MKGAVGVEQTGRCGTGFKAIGREPGEIAGAPHQLIQLLGAGAPDRWPVGNIVPVPVQNGDVHIDGPKPRTEHPVQPVKLVVQLRTAVCIIGRKASNQFVIQIKQVADGLDAAQLLADAVRQLKHIGFLRLHNKLLGVSLLQRKQQKAKPDDGNDKNQDKVHDQLGSQIEMMLFQSKNSFFLFSAKILYHFLVQ